jgi:NADH-quinone oxidoreductase subunit N
MITLTAAVASAASTALPKLSAPKIHYLAILPVLVMIGGAVLLLAMSSLSRRRIDVTWTTSVTVAVGTAGLILAFFQWGNVISHGPSTTVDSAVVLDGFSALVTMLLSLTVIIAALVGDGWLRQRIGDRTGDIGTEYHALSLVCVSGAIMMGMANDLIVVFLGLEIMSIALYVLAAFDNRRTKSGEAALKYFVLGAFSSAIFLYGIALVYGSTGSTDLLQIADFLARNILLHNGLLLAGLALLIVGFGFKIAAVPFHLWTPDVYEGSPTPVAGFMASVAKIGGFAAFIRVFITSFGSLSSDWRPIVWVIAAVSLLLGAAVALAQRDIKRMMAYSSINHAGFVLLGLQAANAAGVEASLYYLAAYTLLVLGSFAVISAVAGKRDDLNGLDRYRGLAKRRPLLAGAMSVFLLGQAGIPLTTGFLAKFEVLTAVVRGGSTSLAVIAMLSAVVAGFFYLRVIILMYSPADAEAEAPGGDLDPVLEIPAAYEAITSQATATATAVSAGTVTAEQDEIAVPASTGFAIFICVFGTLFFGIVPEPLLSLAHKATLLFPHFPLS